MNGIVTVFDLAHGRPPLAAMLQRALERAFRFRMFDEWNTEAKTLDALIEALDAEVVQGSHLDTYEALVLEMPDAVIWAGITLKPESKSDIEVDLMAASRHAARHAMARIKELVPAAPVASERISVAFWYSSAGGKKITRTLDAPSWEETRMNYPSATRPLVEALIADPRAAIARGRLLLLFGPPGTGKTSALRTLARENVSTISLEYVLDPEAMFGREAGYFMDVVFDEDDEVERPRTRLLVLEDCDELLSADAKDRSGQGLARLLNLVDGFIGQGLNIAVLITTNEPLSAFHPAVTRPGRCGTVIEFAPFEAGEAAAWLAKSGRHGPIPSGRRTLAELIGGTDHATEKTRPASRDRIGFVTPHEARR